MTAHSPGPAPAAKAPLLTVGDVSPEGAPLGAGASGVKLTNPFAPADSVELSRPEAPALPAAAPKAPVAVAP